jgi:cytochrome c-type biogenesis protein CcmE
VKKSKIIALIGVALSAVIIIIFLTQNVRPYLNVSQVTENPSSYENKEVQVIGIVQGITDDYFNLTEGEDSILVYAGDITVPDDVENGLQIVVTGVLNVLSVLTASQILTQCS